MTRISIAGAGYVGLSLATLLAQHNSVTLVDIMEDRCNKINSRISPIKDEYIEKYFETRNLDLTATSSPSGYDLADFIILAVPTNYDENTNCFDCHIIEEVIDVASIHNSSATYVIKSTVPVGYSKSLQKKYPNLHILFSPEFLREGKALYDNLYPSRIIVGSNLDDYERAKEFSYLLSSASLINDVPILHMNTTEAEAVKLFANTYLAMRVSFFNELDTYASKNDLNTVDIIRGICYDPRIGNFYNNPSFGYGGYCLPKDTKQLLANYENIPQNLISAIVASNTTRKEVIAQEIIEKHPHTVGIYRLTMKSGSDNFRQAAIHDIINIIKNSGIEVIVYEPTSNECENRLVNDITKFKRMSDIIVANRIDECLYDVAEKLYTKDIFRNN